MNSPSSFGVGFFVTVGEVCGSLQSKSQNFSKSTDFFNLIFSPVIFFLLVVLVFTLFGVCSRFVWTNAEVERATNGKRKDLAT